MCLDIKSKEEERALAKHESKQNGWASEIKYLWECETND